MSQNNNPTRAELRAKQRRAAINHSINCICAEVEGRPLPPRYHDKPEGVSRQAYRAALRRKDWPQTAMEPTSIEANQPRAGRVPLIAYGTERRPAWLIEAMKPKNTKTRSTK